MGIYPVPFLDVMDASVVNLIDRFEAARAVTATLAGR
jgi:hypothetical protein